MKTITRFRLLAVFCLLLGTKAGFSQCSSTITANSQGCGNASFYATTAGYSSVTPSNFAWDFGDGITTSGTNMQYASHIYTATGVYTVVLTYTNAANTCTSTSSQTVAAFVLPLSFTTTQGSNGLVNFANTTSNIPPGTTFLWNFGGQATSTQSSTAYTFSNNGIYYVTLTGYGAAGGYCSTNGSVSVNSGTSCSASMIINQGVSGNVSFSGSAANNTSLTPYGTFSWNFANGTTSVVNGPNYSQANTTYTTNGIYTVTLSFVNGANTCSSVATQTISITNAGVCNLTANFFWQPVNSSGSVYFSNGNSSGVIPGATSTWAFGDGSPNGSGSTLTHVYTTPGNYVATLTINNNITPACISTKTAIVTSCLMSATVSAITNTNGIASFTLASPGSTTGTNYSWNFGDGGTYNATGSAGVNVTHTYIAVGFYSVTVMMINPNTCSTTAQYLLNISSVGTCSANSNFSMVPTTTAQVWFVTPAAPGSIVSALWNWGDNSSSNALYTSHTYSAAATYDICLSVTVTCGASSTTCASYAIYKPQQDMNIIQVTVVDPETITGIKNNKANDLYSTVSPNPSTGAFNVSLHGSDIKGARITVVDLVGKKIYETNAESIDGKVSKDIQLNAANGVYFIKMETGVKTLTQKLILTN